MRTKAGQRVLLVMSNPLNTEPLQLGQEARAIFQAIQAANQSDVIDIRPLFAATANDLRRALLRDVYTLVHFAGHSDAGGLVFEDEYEKSRTLSIESIGRLLSAYPSVRCVLLNTCDIAGQSELATRLGVPYVIGMEGQISDVHAIEFAKGFYDALAYGHDIERAYTEGCNAVALATDESVPYVPRLFFHAPRGFLFFLESDDFQRIELRQESTKVGRGHSDVLVPEKYVRVSHPHAQVDVRDRQFFVTDLGSRLGTFVDGIRLTEAATEVLAGQIVTLGGAERDTLGVCTITFSKHGYLPTGIA
jgi:hypothetical protein